MSARVTRYEIRDAKGELIAVHVRRDCNDGGKGFVWERPDGTTGLDGLPTAQLPLHGSQDVAGWDVNEPILLVEGEKARDALTRCGFHALATVTGASSCPASGPLAVLLGHHVILWPDADAPGRSHMHRLAERLVGIASSIRVFEWAGAPERGDAADYLASEPDAVKRLRVELAGARPASEYLTTSEAPVSVSSIASAAFESLPEQPSRDDWVAALRRLAGMVHGRDELDQVAVRHEAVGRLKSGGLAAQEAQALVRAAFQNRNGSASSQNLQGTALDLDDPAPSPNPVDGAALAGEMTALLLRYVVLPLEAARVVVLWVFFTYLLEYVDVAPRLLMTSPTKACGKTRLLTLLSALARKALPSSSVTPAAMFRVIEAHAPTLLLDEVDNLRLGERPDLLAMVNSGHTRGTASVLRTVGEEHELRCFSTWCSLAMAGIRAGGLPDTVTSRSIKIQLVRKRKVDQVTRLRETQLHRELEPLRQKLMRWSTDHAGQVKDAEPSLPNELDGRTADNWSVLVSIADTLGGGWPEWARSAALALEGAALSSENVGETLLADLRELFDAHGGDRLTSEEITKALAKLEGRPWAEWGKQRMPLSKNQLARLLKEFEIEPGTIRLAGGATAKGYWRERFEDAWERYLSAPTASEPSQRREAGMERVESEFQSVTDGRAVTDQDCLRAAPIAAGDGVTVQQPPLGEDAAVPPGPREDSLDGSWPGADS